MYGHSSYAVRDAGGQPCADRLQSRIEPAGALLPAVLIDAAISHGLAHRRFDLGGLEIDLHHFAKASTIEFRAVPGQALLLLPLTDGIGITNDDACLTCRAGTPFLFSREDGVATIWRAASWGLAVRFRRHPVQVAASAALGSARRLAGVCLPLERYSDDDDLEAVLRQVIQQIGVPAFARTGAAPEIEPMLCRALAARLVTRPDADTILPKMRSVSEAMRHVRADHRKSHDTASLAALVGVTAPTLRKGFKAGLGTTVTEFVQAVRLDWARERLASACESRKIAAIAVDAGFADGPTFSRAYQRRFGETPSQARIRAVHAAG